MSRYGSVMDLPKQHRAAAQAQINGRRPARNPYAVAELEAKLDRGPPKPSKYRNVRVFLEGEWFDSQLEYDCYCWLRARRQAGEIAYLKRQVTFVLEGGVKYRADFEAVLTLPYAIKAGFCSEVWDAKGCDTRSSINKRKQVKARYGVEVLLWKK